jgi:polyphenol oxidase
MTNRRTFIALGASAAAATLGGTPIGAAAQLTPTCTQPWPAGTTPTPWSAPSDQKLIDRISAYHPSYNWQRLTNAYAAMRALPASDPRSLAAQQNVHAWYCQQCMGEPPPNDIHGRWTFFVWHRAFLYFHERILGLLVKDTTLRLPYWDWENPARQNLPSQYYQGPLNDTTRALQPGHSVQRNVPGVGFYDLINGVPPEIGLDFTGIGGDASSSGDVEVHPHGFVHMSVGGLNGDMGNLELAAGDPIFFAHHSNVDRLWYSWENYNGNVDPAGLKALGPFTFYDGTAWRSMTGAQMLPSTAIGYAYDTKVTPPAPFRKKIPLLMQQNRVLKLPDPPDLKAISASDKIAVSLSRVQFSGAGSFTVSVKNATGSHVVGTFFVVPHGKHAMSTSHAANVRFIVPSSTAKALAQPGAAVTMSRSNGTSLTAGAPAPAKLSGITLSVR